MDNLMFYYSGTGNSLYDAISIGKGLKNVKLISMRHLENHEFTATDCKTMGFIFPVHHWGIPEAVTHFIKTLKIHHAEYIYAFITYGSFEANSRQELSKLLEDKGLKLDYAALHKNVNSHITSVFATAYNISQNVKAENELDKMIHDILDQKKTKTPKVNPVKRASKKVFRQWIEAYEIPDEDFFINGACRRCGICRDLCGRNNIELKENGPRFLHNCDECLACIQYCPHEALYARRIKEERKRYHHPFVSHSRIAKPQIIIKNGNIVE